MHQCVVNINSWCCSLTVTQLLTIKLHLLSHSHFRHLQSCVEHVRRHLDLCSKGTFNMREHIFIDKKTSESTRRNTKRRIQLSVHNCCPRRRQRCAVRVAIPIRKLNWEILRILSYSLLLFVCVNVHVCVWVLASVCVWCSTRRSSCALINLCSCHSCQLPVCPLPGFILLPLWFKSRPLLAVPVCVRASLCVSVRVSACVFVFVISINGKSKASFPAPLFSCFLVCFLPPARHAPPKRNRIEHKQKHYHRQTTWPTGRTSTTHICRPQTLRTIARCWRSSASDTTNWRIALCL